MTKLTRFNDGGRMGCWANIVMDNGDPCWIGIAQTGVLVKKSRLGWFGAELYRERNLHEAAMAAMGLADRYPETLTPPGLQHLVLQAFTNAVLHCATLVEVIEVLNHPYGDSPPS